MESKVVAIEKIKEALLIFESTKRAREKLVGATQAETADQRRTGKPRLSRRSLWPGALL